MCPWSLENAEARNNFLVFQKCTELFNGCCYPKNHHWCTIFVIPIGILVETSGCSC